jgi:hypothetical protein
MADEPKEPWLNWLALTTVFLAAAATFSTSKGGGYSTRSVLRQNQASDQWNFYQAKSLKGNLYEIEQARLAREIKTAEGAKGGAAQVEELKKALADVDARVTRYTKEKEDIQKEAKKLEAERDDAARHGAPFGLATIFLQLSIILSSVSALMKKQPLYWAGLALGIVGLIYFANGFFLWF